MSTDTNEIKVFISHRDSICDECQEPLGRNAWIRLAGERGALCLACADLDHLAFLPTGDAALTRRARGRPLEEIIPVGLDGLRALIEAFLAVGFSKFVVRPLAPPAEWRAELEPLAAAVGGLQT